MGRKQKKPLSRLEITKMIVEILAGIANIILIIHTILKGWAPGKENLPRPHSNQSTCKSQGGSMKEFLTALGVLLIAFGAVKLVLAAVQRRKEQNDGRE